MNDNNKYSGITAPYASANIKFRRLAAWLIDWSVIGFTVFILLVISVHILKTTNKLNENWAVVFLFCLFLLYPVCFVLRDIILKGRSLGKRIMRLVIIDKQTHNTASAPKRLLRNIFLFIFPFDAIVLLLNVNGNSIGDLCAGTMVVAKKDAYSI